MPVFGIRSKRKLSTLDTRLQRILCSVIEVYDFSITEGHRSNERQQQLYDKGFSQKKAGESKHNTYPSLAVDISPYPIDYSKLSSKPYDYKEYGKITFLMGAIYHTAHIMGYKIRLGIDFNQNMDFTDDKFTDAFHVEILD